MFVRAGVFTNRITWSPYRRHGSRDQRASGRYNLLRERRNRVGVGLGSARAGVDLACVFGKNRLDRRALLTSGSDEHPHDRRAVAVALALARPQTRKTGSGLNPYGRAFRPSSRRNAGRRWHSSSVLSPPIKGGATSHRRGIAPTIFPHYLAGLRRTAAVRQSAT